MHRHDGEPTPTIRPARAADLPRLVELIALGAARPRTRNGTVTNDHRAAFDEISATGHNEVLVAVLDGDVVVGTVQVFAVRQVQHNGGLCAEIESMHVHPDRRGAGVGALLVDAAVDLARGWGCYRVQLTSDKARVDAHRFYRRAGFEATHEGFKRYLTP